MRKSKHFGVKGLSVLVMGVLGITSLALFGQGKASAGNFNAGTCSPVNIPVALSSDQPATQTIHGTLCDPFRWKGTHEVDVLVHGASYNSSYWNFPVNNALYSYVNDTLLAGRATFAYDKLGAGVSSHPVSSEITGDAQSFILHQVLDYLKGLKDARGNDKYAKFATVGHSLGSITVLNESATYQDENLVVLTGLSHSVSPAGATASANSAYPANLDPQFSGKGYDDGYLTTTPGSRNLFYSNIASSKIVSYDDAHKDVYSVAELAASIGTVMTPADSNISRNVTAPVLIVLGQKDQLFCQTDAPVGGCNSESALLSFEKPFFPNAASVTVQVTPATGHVLALHPTNPLTFVRINNWIGAH